MTALDLDRAKDEVILSLIPLLIFIVFILYAFCRHGVFSVCNPLNSCGCHRADEIRAGAGGGVDDDVNGSVAIDKSISPLSPKKLLDYKRGTSGQQKTSVSLIDGRLIDIEEKEAIAIPPTIQEDSDDGEIGTLKVTSQTSSSKYTQKLGKKRSIDESTIIMF